MIVEQHEPVLTSEDAKVEGRTCLNCGEPVVGNYCPQCGQHVGEHNKGLWAFIQEFLDEFISLDSKFFRTLVPLTFKPGWLTRQWVAGKRVRYITPLKLYITLSAICFLLLSLTASPVVARSTSDNLPRSTKVRKELNEDDLAKMSPLERTIMGPISRLSKNGPEGEANRKQFGEKFLSDLSTANLILLPIFALLFKCLYVRRSRFYVEHLAFALHYYAFFSLTTSVAIVLSKTPSIPLGAQLVFPIGPILLVPLVLWMIAYLPVAMVVNYRQGIVKTLFKCWIFCSIYLVTVGFVLLAMIYTTALQIAPSSTSAPVTSKPRS